MRTMSFLSNWHGLVWQKAWLEGKNVFLVFGPGQLVTTAYAYLLSIISTVLAVRWVVTSVGLRRWQALWYFTGVLVSWFCHGMWRVLGGSFELMSWGFLINGVIVTWIYYRWQFYNILPLAQAVASRHVIDGLLIVDDEGYVVDINPAAKKDVRRFACGCGQGSSSGRDDGRNSAGSFADRRRRLTGM